jgi:hypothetical protein
VRVGFFLGFMLDLVDVVAMGGCHGCARCNAFCEDALFLFLICSSNIFETFLAASASQVIFTIRKAFVPVSFTTKMPSKSCNFLERLSRLRTFCACVGDDK